MNKKTSNNASPQGKCFQFKQFLIEIKNCGMPVSTDGVLLGAWASAHQKDRILDIGTGTGLLALIMAQRFTKSKITAIDLEPLAVEVAQYNVSQSPWAKRIHVFEQNALTWKPTHSFDTIICNPPYFSQGRSSQNSQRAMARHVEHLPHKPLLHQMAQCLKLQGNAFLILPKEEGIQLIQDANACGLHCHQVVFVKTTPNKPVTRLLIHLKKNAQKTKFYRQQTLVIQNAHGYSSDFIRLTKDFYLKM